ncbi:MAG TPA: tetratricopeptide repeat protein [Candidatus Binatia bacterium]|nr:tetratricopeptide repeat protein [Candidatus Binatia bacterium]
MKHFVRWGAILTLALVAGPPAPAQQTAPPVGSIQKMLAVDQLFEQKEYEDAIVGYKALLADDPRNPQLMNRIGIAYEALHNLPEARHYYERALKADPNYSAAVNNLGSLEYNNKNFGKAARDYRRAIRMDPTVASYYSNLAYTCLARKKYQEMVAAFISALQLDPGILDQHNRSGSVIVERGVEDHATFYFYLAKTYGQMGDADRCVGFLKKARDEKFKDILSVRTDPAFAPVRSKPVMKDFLDSLNPASVDRPTSSA